MKSIDTFKTCSQITINDKKYTYFDLNILADHFNFKLKVSNITLLGGGISTKYITAKKTIKIAKKNKLI